MAYKAPESSNLSPPKSNILQEVVGNFLYYERAVYPIMLVELNILDVKQSNITQATSKLVTQLLNYSSAHSEAITIYCSSGMVLQIHSGAHFL